MPYTHKLAHMHARIYTHEHTRANTCTHACPHTHACIHTHEHTGAHTYTCTRARPRTRTHRGWWSGPSGFPTGASLRTADRASSDRDRKTPDQTRRRFGEELAKAHRAPSGRGQSRGLPGGPGTEPRALGLWPEIPERPTRPNPHLRTQSPVPPPDHVSGPSAGLAEAACGGTKHPPPRSGAPAGGPGPAGQHHGLRPSRAVWGGEHPGAQGSTPYQPS